jgi:hypothetical protein
MAEEAQQLLAAEEAVQELLTNLKVLKSEIDHYSEAKSSLADTRDAVVNLAAELSGLTGRAAGIIETIGEVGTPEILVRDRDSPRLHSGDSGTRYRDQCGTREAD